MQAGDFHAPGASGLASSAKRSVGNRSPRPGDAYSAPLGLAGIPSVLLHDPPPLSRTRSLSNPARPQLTIRQPTPPQAARTMDPKPATGLGAHQAVPARAEPTPMETMKAERTNCPFNLRRMTYAMGGGKRGKPSVYQLGVGRPR